MGQEIEVKCIEENNGKYRLSRRVLLQGGQPSQPVRK